MWISARLDCEHTQYVRLTKLVPKKPGDTTYILCNMCAKTKRAVGKPDLAWRPVLSLKKVPDAAMHNVSNGNAYVLPRYIMRIPATGSAYFPYR